MQLTQHCPCCQANIGLKTMFHLWSEASKKEEKTIYCSSCSKPIGNIADYERYGLAGALPLFAAPIAYDSATSAYVMAGVILAYTFVLFYLLYRVVPLRCIETSEAKTNDKKDIEEDEKNNLIAAIIISVVFFVSIFALFAPLFSK